MNALFSTDRVGNRKRFVFRRIAIVRPIAMIEVLDRTKESQGATRRTLHRRMRRNRFLGLPMLFLTLMLSANQIWALPMGDRISYRDFTFPSLIDPFFIDISAYSIVFAPWPHNVSKRPLAKEYIGRAELEIANRRAINQLKTIIPTMRQGSVLLGDAAGGKIRFVLDDESEDIGTEDEQAEETEHIESVP